MSRNRFLITLAVAGLSFQFMDIGSPSALRGAILPLIFIVSALMGLFSVLAWFDIDFWGGGFGSSDGGSWGDGFGSGDGGDSGGD